MSQSHAAVAELPARERQVKVLGREDDPVPLCLEEVGEYVRDGLLRDAVLSEVLGPDKEAMVGRALHFDADGREYYGIVVCTSYAVLNERRTAQIGNKWIVLTTRMVAPIPRRQNDF